MFDTTPLVHMAKAQVLGVLKILVGARTAVVTDVVEDEIRKGAHRHAALQAVLESDCLELHSLSSDEEMSWYLQFADEYSTSGARVPFRVGGFISWAHDIGALGPRD